MKIIIMFVLLFLPFFVDAKLVDDNFSLVNENGVLADFAGSEEFKKVENNNYLYMFVSNNLLVYNKKTKSITTKKYEKYLDNYDMKLIGDNLFINNGNFELFDTNLNYLLIKDCTYFKIYDNKLILVYEDRVEVYDSMGKLLKKYPLEENKFIIKDDTDSIGFFVSSEGLYIVNNNETCSLFVFMDKSLNFKEVKLASYDLGVINSYAYIFNDKLLLLDHSNGKYRLVLIDSDGNVLKEGSVPFTDCYFGSKGMDLFIVKVIHDDPNVYKTSYHLVHDDLTIDAEAYKDPPYEESDISKIISNKYRKYDIASYGPKMVLVGEEDNHVYASIFDTKAKKFLVEKHIGDDPSTYSDSASIGVKSFRIGDYVGIITNIDYDLRVLIYNKDNTLVYDKQIDLKDKYGEEIGIDDVDLIISNVLVKKNGFRFFVVFRFMQYANGFKNAKDTNLAEEPFIFKYLDLDFTFNYRVNKNDDNIKISNNEAKMGDIIKVEFLNRKGYELGETYAVDLDGKKIPIVNGEFIMPNSNVKIYATYNPIAENIENPNTVDMILIVVISIVISGGLTVYLCRRKNKYI